MKKLRRHDWVIMKYYTYLRYLGESLKISVVVTTTRNDKKLTIEKANRNYDMK